MALVLTGTTGSYWSLDGPRGSDDGCYGGNVACTAVDTICIPDDTYTVVVGGEGQGSSDGSGYPCWEAEA